MIGIFFNCDGEAAEMEPLRLHDNFYRAISEAEHKTGGNATCINQYSQWAVISACHKKNQYRVLVCRE